MSPIHVFPKNEIMYDFISMLSFCESLCKEWNYLRLHFNTIILRIAKCKERDCLLLLAFYTAVFDSIFSCCGSLMLPYLYPLLENLFLWKGIYGFDSLSMTFKAYNLLVHVYGVLDIVDTVCVEPQEVMLCHTDLHINCYMNGRLPWLH